MLMLCLYFFIQFDPDEADNDMGLTTRNTEEFRYEVLKLISFLEFTIIVFTDHSLVGFQNLNFGILVLEQQ